MKVPRVFRGGLVAAACVALAVPAEAGAAHIEVHGGMLRVEAGDATHMVVERAGTGVDVNDSSGLVLGSGCSPAGSDPQVTSAHCEGPVDNVNASLSGGDDYLRIAGSGLSSWVDGSLGDDTLIGGPGDDILQGAEGEDTLNGGAGSDWLRGGLDGDSLTGGPNGDYIFGEEGPDVLNSEDPVPPAEPWYLQPMPATDDVYCGAGEDVATADDYDGELWCERIEYPGGRVVTPAYAAGPNGPWEDAAAVVPSAGDSSIYALLTLTSQGDALAAWSQYQQGSSQTRWAVKRHGEPLTTPAAATCCVVGLESDQSGNAVMLSRTSSGDLQASVRPPGGDFGAPVTLASDVSQATLISNPQGDIAAVYGGLASIRPRGGSAFQAPVATGAVGSVVAVALAGNGDLITVSEGPPSGDDDEPHARLFASIRKADGTAVPPQAISSGRRAFEAPQLVADASGDAALVWNEPRLIYSDQVSPSPYSVSDVNLISERVAGGTFSAPAVVPGAEAEASDPKVAMSGDGLVTVAFPHQSYVGRVVSAPVGQPLQPVRSFGLNMMPTSVELASNAAGDALLTWSPADVSHAVTTFRTGTGELGPVEDLRPGCEHADTVVTKLNEAGEAAALIMDHGVPYVTTLTDPSVRGHQECAMSSVYRDDPDAGIHREGPRTKIHPPEVAELRLARVAVPGEGGGKTTVYAAVDCPGHCDFKLTVSRKSRRGRVLASTSQRFVSPTRRRLSASARIPTVPKSHRRFALKRLFIRIDGRDRHWRPVTVARQVDLR